MSSRQDEDVGARSILRYDDLDSDRSADSDVHFRRLPTNRYSASPSPAPVRELQGDEISAHHPSPIPSENMQEQEDYAPSTHAQVERSHNRDNRPSEASDRERLERHSGQSDHPFDQERWNEPDYNRESNISYSEYNQRSAPRYSYYNTHRRTRYQRPRSRYHQDTDVRLYQTDPRERSPSRNQSSLASGYRQGSQSPILDYGDESSSYQRFNIRDADITQEHRGRQNSASSSRQHLDALRLPGSNRERENNSVRGSLQQTSALSTDDFIVVSEPGVNILDMKFCSPDGTFVCGKLQRRRENLIDVRRHYNEWIEDHCSCIELEEARDYNSLLNAIIWLTGLGQDQWTDRHGASFSRDYDHPIFVQPILDHSEDLEEGSDAGYSTDEDPEIDDQQEGPSTPAYDPEQADLPVYERLLHSDRANDHEHTAALQAENDADSWENSQRNRNLQTLASRLVIGMSVSWSCGNQGTIMYLASEERVVAIFLSRLHESESWSRASTLLLKIFENKKLHIQAWRAAEYCIKLTKLFHLCICIRDLTFGHGETYKNLYRAIFNNAEVSPNKASPFFIARGRRLRTTLQLVEAHHSETATEAYRCALMNRNNTIAITRINSVKLLPYIDILYKYVQTLDVQNTNSNETYTKSSVDFDEERTGMRVSNYYWPTREVVHRDNLASFKIVPHLEVFCNRLQSQPMISTSQVVHVALMYKYGDKKIYSDMYGLCYKTSGQNACICFPTSLDPRSKGNFTIPLEDPKSVTMVLEDPPIKCKAMTILSISVIGKQVPSAQGKQEYKMLSSACAEVSQSEFRLCFNDKSNLIAFVDKDLGSLPFIQNRETEYEKRRQFYDRLRQTSVFSHFKRLISAPLNEKQLEAVQQILSEKSIVVAVEGPPGTGKSSVIAFAISYFKKELERKSRNIWYESYIQRLIWQLYPYSEDSKNLVPVEGHDIRKKERLIERDFLEDNEIEPMILVLAHTNASKLHLAEKDDTLAGSSIVMKSMRLSSFDSSTYQGVRIECCTSKNFKTVKKAIQTLKKRRVMYATIGAFHTIAKTFLKVANVQCIIFEECSLIHPLELSALLSMFSVLPKIVLCGDVKQLPAYGSDELKRARPLEDIHSALQNVLNIARGDRHDRAGAFLRDYTSVVSLERSYRLPMNLLSLLRNDRYGNNLYDREGTHIPYDEINCSNELLFFGYRSSRDKSEEQAQGSTSWVNHDEANAVLTLLRIIHDRAPELLERTKVLTFYAGQQLLLTKLLKRTDALPYLQILERRVPNTIQNIVSTLDPFQGKEDDIIILCPTRLFGTESRDNFTIDVNRLTVAFSRAKKYVVFMTHPEQMERLRIAEDWDHLIEKLFSKGAKLSEVHAETEFEARIIEIANQSSNPR